MQVNQGVPMQHSGYYLWEGITFLMQILVGTGLLVLRRKAGGRAAFTEADRQTCSSPVPE